MTFSSLLASLPDVAIIAGKDRVIRFHNRLAAELFQSDIVGQDITQLLRKPVFSTAFSKLSDGAQNIEVDLEIHGSLNSHVRVFLSAISGTDLNLVLLRDFTREQAIEKMRSDFVANASHEMRTPLASIIGSIETLQGAARNDAKARDQFLGTMLTQAQRMKRLIDDLLNLSRIELNEHVKPSARVSLNDVVQQAKSNLSGLTSTSNVSVTLKGNGKIDVQGDADELLQVVQNLLENAIKYGASGGRIEIDCYAHGGHGVLAVRDFGKGIADFHVPRLTERFYRVNTQESRSRGGTGLGLAIVKHIVLRHRGKLAVSSVEGEGSTFTVSIPLFES